MTNGKNETSLQNTQGKFLQWNWFKDKNKNTEKNTEKNVYMMNLIKNGKLFNILQCYDIIFRLAF